MQSYAPIDTSNRTAQSLANSALSKFSTSWADMSVTGLDLTALLASLLTIQNLLYMFDYLYRIFQTVRLVSRFWSRGAVNLPQMDMRKGADSKVNSKALRYFSYALQVMPFIWLQILLVLFFLTIILWAVAGSRTCCRSHCDSCG